MNGLPETDAAGGFRWWLRRRGRADATMGGMTDSNSTRAYPDPWPAPLAAHPLDATVTIPGSKSLSNRYLILSALGKRPVTLVGLLRSRDTDLMMGALKAFGVKCDVDPDDETTVTVTPPASGRFHGGETVYCGLAGTVMRFVPGLALHADAPVRFDGDAQAYKRPMKPLLDGLTQMGARVDYEGEEGFLPFTITPPQAVDSADSADPADSAAATELHVTIDSSGSSQFISGLLMAASRFPRPVAITHRGAHLPSLPHIRMTMVDLKASGIGVTMDDTVTTEGTATMDDAESDATAAAHAVTWHVTPGEVQLPGRVVVEPDLSNAAPFLGAALIAGGTVRVPNWPENTTQPGGLLPQYLRDFGAQAQRSADGVMTVTSDGVASGSVHGLGDFDLSAAGEIAPSLAAIAILAHGDTALHGIAHLRGHETNRLAALVAEIARIGGDAEELDDGIRIGSVPLTSLHGAVMETYADHRMATFAAMIGLVVPGVEVTNVATTRKTIPDFPGMWNAMLAQHR